MTETQAPAEISVYRRRTFWDVVLGFLLVICGLILLGNTVWATVISVLFIGWMTFVSGLLAAVAAIAHIRRPGSWVDVITAVLLIVLGLMILRHPISAALTLTLLAGVIFLVSGIMRIVASKDLPGRRWVLIVSGIISTALGVIVLFDLVRSTMTLLGVLLGVQVLVDGFTIMLNGRLRAEIVPAQTPASAPDARSALAGDTAAG